MIWRADPAAEMHADPTAQNMPEVVPEYWDAAASDQRGHGMWPPREERDAADRLFWPLVVSALIQGVLLIMASIMVWGMR